MFVGSRRCSLMFGITSKLINATICKRMLSATVVRPKLKVPQKKASSMLSQLKVEEFANLRNGRQWPELRAGDSVEIEVSALNALLFLFR